MKRILFAACLLCLAGCGSSTASVTGVVYLDGERLGAGNVAFNPVGEGPVANGSIDASGRYTLQVGAGSGVPPGDYVVVVVAYKPFEPDPNSLEEKAPEPLTPAVYGTKETSPLKFTLKPGSNTINLELVSK
jgi:hypothetical protein